MTTSRKHGIDFIRICFLFSIFSFGLSLRCSAQEDGGLTSNPARGNLSIVRDASIFKQDSTFYVFSTDPKVHAPNEYLPIRCSQDLLNWRVCGHVFNSMPVWARKAVAQADNLWAPDISFFEGTYHLYYCVSTAGSQNSAIGLATNKTLDTESPDYRWVDRGLVLTSQSGDDFNAIDPNILIDSDDRVWLTYGSYWSGIKQREVDPATGMLSAFNHKAWSVAFRPDHKVVEGPSLLYHEGFYFLFVSYGRCCSPDLSQDDYKEAVGRSKSVHGPFVDRQGRSLSDGGGTVLLRGNASWVAPGGGSAWSDSANGKSLLIFHSLDAEHNGRATLWIKPLRWESGWPVVD